MACPSCDNLCIRYAIRHPRDLHHAIEIAKQNINDGTLVEVQDSSPHSDVSFNVIASGGAWGDIVAYRFKCRSCGELFALHAETYHGSGGCWEPEDASVVRETL